MDYYYKNMDKHNFTSGGLCDECEEDTVTNAMMHFAYTDCHENKIDRLKEIAKLLYKQDLFNHQINETRARNNEVMASKMNALKTGGKKSRSNKYRKQMS